MSDFAERYDEASEEVLAELEENIESIDPASVRDLHRNLESRSGIFRRSRTCHACTSAYEEILRTFGIKAHCVGEINEPAIKKDDLLIVGSGSGGSLFPLGTCKESKRNSRLHHCTYLIKSEQSMKEHCRLYGKNSSSYQELSGKTKLIPVSR